VPDFRDGSIQEQFKNDLIKAIRAIEKEIDDLKVELCRSRR
jgi:hypothetical protein